MSTWDIPASGLTLLGRSNSENHASSNHAILLKLNERILQDIKNASAKGSGLLFETGKVPHFRIGGQTFGLNIASDPFRNELYEYEDGQLHFSSVINHRAEVRGEERARTDTTGADAALAALQNSLASYASEKKAQAANISHSILPTPKNRFEAAREQRRNGRRGLLDSARGSESPMTSASTPRFGPAPTSIPAGESAAKTQAMRQALIHLLAMGPASVEDVRSKTRIPKDQLEKVLQKLGKQVDGRWQLLDRSFKELDVWRFKYSSQDDRQAAVDNAVKAYDRLRLGKDEKLWQLLLPKEDRGKGVVLSRLHLAGTQQNRSSTPALSAADSPRPTHEGLSEGKVLSAANTPRLGASTPRPTSGKGDIMKRLLAKDPKKARAAVEAKEKKRKDPHDGASDREISKPAKRQALSAGKASSKVKSAEIIHSSDEPSSEEEGEVKTSPEKQQPQTSQSQTRSAMSVKKKPAATASSPDSSDEPAPPTSRLVAKAIARRAAANNKSVPSKPASSPALKPARTPQPGKATPTTTHGLTAPSQKQQPQYSPQKSHSRALAPSPLGDARPRVPSDVSDRSAIGVQKGRTGAETPKGLGITNGFRKRQNTNTSSDSAISIPAEHKRNNNPGPSQSTQASGAQKPSSNATDSNKARASTTTTGTKRKAEAHSKDTTAQPPNKKLHQKNHSMSSNSQQSASGSRSAGSTATGSSTAHTSPEAVAVFDNTSDSNASSYSSAQHAILSDADRIRLTALFEDELFPVYTQLYAAQQAKKARGEKLDKRETDELWAMHRRLEAMKRKIREAEQAAAAGGAAFGDVNGGGAELSFGQAVRLARDFEDKFYPAYERLFDEVEEAKRRGKAVPREQRDKLWAMHRRLEQMQRDINTAGEKKDREGRKV